jgi:hypothetical protein
MLKFSLEQKFRRGCGEIMLKIGFSRQIIPRSTRSWVECRGNGLKYPLSGWFPREGGEKGPFWCDL